MSLLDNVRQTLGEAANTAKEVGQNLGAQAQSQINIKKLQIGHDKKLRDLGEKTHAWYQSGQMIVTGNVPVDVQQLCRDVDASSTQLQLEEARLEDFKQQAALRSQNKDSSGETYSVLPENNPTKDNAMNKNTDTQKLSAHENQSGGVTIPGTSIVTNPTTPHPEPATIPGAVPAISGAETSGDEAPVVPVSDLAPSPSGETVIGGGTMPGAPGGSDTLGGGISGGGIGGPGGGFSGGTM